ncbi:MAG: hypothetical protein WDW36_006533 [Sanguina aurantia]
MPRLSPHRERVTRLQPARTCNPHALLRMHRLSPHRERVTPLLRALCSGVLHTKELHAALGGLVAASALVRAAALAALPSVPLLCEGCCPDEDDHAAALLFIGCHDVAEGNVEAAANLWDMSGAFLRPSLTPLLVSHLTSAAEDVRAAAAAATASAMEVFPETVPEGLTAMLALYEGGSWYARVGVALGLKACAQSLGQEHVPRVIDFLVQGGLADPDDRVREDMVAGGVAVVDAHGGHHAQTLLPLFERYLEKVKGLSSEEEIRYDLVREGVVVFLGTLAKHLGAQDPKRLAVVETLVDVLSTPSESVQRAVSSCLAPLVAAMAAQREWVEALVLQLMKRLTTGGSYGERRGAAFGLSAVVKGCGIMAMKGYGIMEALRNAVEDKSAATAREGALLAFEALSDKLGRLFEPYIITLLPLLLNCFGDSAPAVRQATEEASRMIMGQLTASGVKLVLPALLRGLEDRVWRTKVGSVQLLGAMAHCAPKQLGSCLPTIVPQLGEVLSDPHPKVQAAANQALNEIGSVIRNPEVQALVPSLLGAIADPGNATKPCLDTLLDTTFINTIDAPSLSLIVPVLYRGLRDRSGDTKKRAARIVGNLGSLINDPKDMAPYVPMLMPELQKALVDPLPEVRATSARAMGSLVAGMGQSTFGSLVPWLAETLKSEGSSVERSGAAQGLAEVLSVLGDSHLEALLPDVIEGCSSRSASEREGQLTLFQYLPLTMQDSFQTHLKDVLPAILNGLSDESEGVREAALASGRILVDLYAHSAMDLLLPAMEEGIFHDNWRIRQSSVKLMGKLLFKVAGTTGNVVVDGGSDDEGAAEEGYANAIIDALGMTHRNEVHARLYIARSDTQYPVRTEALHVWKTIVVNTPKTLGQILPVLMAQVIESLAHDGEDRRLMAARCIGELVRKMGERVLAKIIPILRQGMGSPSAATRQGVCAGLKEVLDNVGRPQLLDHLGDILPAVQAALCDSNTAVREAAGAAFAILSKGSSGSAVDSVVPSMLSGLASPGKFDESLEGLRVILSVRPTIFNFLVPKLLKAPLNAPNLSALGSLASVGAPSLHLHIGAIMPLLLPLIGGPADEDSRVAGAARLALPAVALAIQEEGLHLLISEFLRGLEDHERRKGTAGLTTYVKSATVDFQEHVPSLLGALVLLLAEDEPTVLLPAWKALEALTASIPKEDLPNYVRTLRDSVASAREKERRKRKGGPLLLAGCCLPKALAPMLPIYLMGVQHGSSAELREAAAEGLGELVCVTSEEALRPFVVQITGPLIRIIGDRFPSQIKAAILLTLGLLMGKAGTALKPFVPQLQTTCLKCLNDPSDVVRQRAATNLGELTRMSARVDPLALDLANSGRTAEAQVRDSYLSALTGLLISSGERLQPATLATLVEVLRDTQRSVGEDEAFRVRVAMALGAVCRHAAPELTRGVLTGPGGPLAPSLPQQANDRHFAGVLLAGVAQHAPTQLESAGLLKQFSDAVSMLSRDERMVIKISAGRAAARLAAGVHSMLPSTASLLQALLSPDQASEVQRQALLATRRLAIQLAESEPPCLHLLEPHYPALLPSLCALVADTTGPTKAAAERTLARVFGLETSSDAALRFLGGSPGAVARSVLTEIFLRRLAKLTDEDEFIVEDY